MATRPESGFSAARPTARRGALLALCVLAAASLAWALFQWRELLRLRGGAEVNCPLGEGAACAQAWDSPFAAAVERVTGLPVAAWGVVWSLAALLLALLLVVRGHRELLWSALLATAGAGVLSVVVLVTRLFAADAFCTSCVGSYALVLAFAAVALLETRRSGWPRLVPGAGMAALLAGFAALILLPVARAVPPPAATKLAAPSPGVPGADALGQLLSTMAPPAAQALSDALAAYRDAPQGPVHPPRALLGPATARVRITDFVDIRCSHCAHLHETLTELRRIAPEGSLAVESRHFPLDAGCNPMLGHKAVGSVSCAAAKALICLEGDPRVFDLAGSYFATQQQLTAEHIYHLASQLRPRASLDACVASDDTNAKLLDDIDWAREHSISGTPLVLVNGRKGSPLPAFLYAIVLAGGDAQHPAFAALPPPRTLAAAK